MNPLPDCDWQPVPADPAPPAAGDLHVYRLNLNALPAAFFEDLSGFSEPEQARARQLVHPQRRRQFTAGRRALRGLMSRMLHTAAEDLHIVLSGSGKPALDPDHHAAAPAFSLSHTGDCLLLAVTGSTAVGVDLEPVAHRPNLLTLAQRFFSTAEFDRLQKAADAEKPECFFRLWTAKEACVKAWGGGISTGFDRFTIHLDPGAPPRLTHDLGPGFPVCSLGHFRPQNGAMGAWAVAENPRNVRYWDLEALFS